MRRHDCTTSDCEIRHTENSSIFTCRVCGRTEEVSTRHREEEKHYALICAIIFIVASAVMCLLSAYTPAVYLAAFAGVAVVWHVTYLVCEPRD